jgi:hypothetical protein
MKITLNIPQSFEVDSVRVVAQVRAEDVAKDMPGYLSARETLDLTIDLQTGQIVDWPVHHNKEYNLYAKVVVDGAYYLLQCGRVIAQRMNDYVPSFFPGVHYGDYLIFNINKSGVITNWRKPILEQELSCFNLAVELELKPVTVNDLGTYSYD